MAQQDYAKLSLFVDQTFQVQITSLHKKTSSGLVAVDLLTEGLGGFSDGSGRVHFTIGFAVPIGGQEFDFDTAVVEKGYHSIQVPVGSKTYVGLGKFLDCDLSQDTNSPLSGTVEWEGAFNKLQ